MTRPLDGVKVTEVSGVVAGPTAGYILGDLGADVVKVEIPTSIERNFFVGAPGMFVALNRSKRSIAIDLKNPEGKEIFYKMIRGSDAFIENLGPGAMDRLGFSYPELKKINPRLIYGSIKGYGAGPRSDKLAYDISIQNETGLTYMTGEEDEPKRLGTSAIDMCAAVFLCLGIVLALREREVTNKGKFVESDLFETGSFLMGYILSAAQVLGQSPPPLNTPGIYFPVYDLFTTADNKKIFMGITSDAQWRRFCEDFGLKELLDERFSTNEKRMKERPYILSEIAKLVSNFPRDELVERLEKCNVVVSIVNNPLEVLEQPQMKAPNKLGEVTYAGLKKTIKTPILPLVMEDITAPTTYITPELGENTEEVLRELGYSDDEVKQLVQGGIVKQFEIQP